MTALQKVNSSISAGASHLDTCIRYHTIIEFALLVGVSANTVRKWIDAGMPFSETAKRVPCKEARHWLNQN